MHGRKGCDTGKPFRHMLSVPSLTTPSIDDSDCCFFKDGRKISVGDCALFQADQDSPALIGIIRCFSTVEESNLNLSVNWLYRPAEVKLAKGVAPVAEPNEVFYSFHSDHVSAASLLHLCKVAFLPKGVELPASFPSFVCRRVYDIDHNCLWWLTDQDYIHGRQKEVNQLLHKTRIEMQATAHLQQDARSPKPVNGSSTVPPLKHSPDSVQHSSPNLSSHAKRKKRERGEQTTQHIKRDQSIRPEEGDSGQLRSGSNLKVEIAKISERGGLVGSEMVERLVQLMQPEKPERKIDLTGRSMLAGIIAATDNVDCLNKFVQLKGLPVFDEWLQEVRRGKIRDRGGVKDGDVSVVENFLLVLLHALDKLPVNLNALQMCNIGKSVNHLRSHRNIEIQKKARSLVDTWKKRVEVEMNMNDTKFGSGQSVAWSGGSRHGSPHGGNRHSSRMSEAAVRTTPVTQSSLKSPSVKRAHENPTSNSASVWAKSALSSANKDEQAPLSANCVEEKSTSSSQSHSNSHCSSGLAKNVMPSVKEDARSSTAGSRSFGKATRNDSKHRKPVYDPQGATSGIKRETVPNRGALVTRLSDVEKLSDAANAVDASVPDANSHKLIVKIPNRGRIVTQSGASSPAHVEKHDAHPCSSADGLSSSVPHSASNDNGRSPIFSEVVSSPSRNEMKPKKALDSSFSSMNALVESCVKFSEANASLSSGDDVGMNLLASVAAGEISKSATVSPNREPDAAEKSCRNQNANRKQLCYDADKQNGVVGVTRNHSGIPSGILHRYEEGCLKSNRNLDEKGGRVADDGTEIANEKSVSNDKSQGQQRPVANQLHGGSLVADDEGKDVASFGDKSEKRVHKDQVSHSSSNLDDVRNNVSSELRNSITTVPDILVEDKSESTNTNEKTVVVSSCTGQEPVAGNLHDISERAGLDHNWSVEENDTSQMPLKQEEEPVQIPVGKEQNDGGGCMGECIENKVVAIVYQPDCSANSVNSPAVDKQEAEAMLKNNTEGSDVNAGEEARKDDDVATTETQVKLGFDLNEEGFSMDDVRSTEPEHSGAGPFPIAVCSVSPLLLPVSSASSSITVTAAAASAKGLFVPLDDLLRNKTELGWRGSAATSAFRPATPRRRLAEASPSPYNKPYLLDPHPCKQAKPPLDIDLNVADERLLDSGCQTSGYDLSNTTLSRCSLGLDLDLNKADEVADVPSSLPGRVTHSIVFSNSETGCGRDFDLNNCLGAADEMPVEKTLYDQHNCGNIPYQGRFGPTRIHSSDAGNCFPWYPPAASYSVSMAPSALPANGGPHRGTGGGPTSNLSFNPDQGSMMSSTRTIPFINSTPFQYPVYPCGSSFPVPPPALSSGFTAPAIPPQLIGTAASAVPFQYPHAYAAAAAVSHPIPRNNAVIENDKKWGKQGLDLNWGPGGADVEGRYESLPTASRHLSVEERAKVYNMAGGILKRKEPEGGWNVDKNKINFKQSSWQ